jgi:predicted lipase
MDNNKNIQALSYFAADVYEAVPVSTADGSEYLNISDHNMFVRITYVGDTVIVAFRGTDDRRDWLFNLARWRRPFLEGPIRAHAGFLLHMEKLYPAIVDVLMSTYPNIKYVQVTGHSLGGGVALLFGAYLAYIYNNIHVHVVTFGAPRVGNRALKTWCDTKSNLVCVRVYNKKDIVPKLPYFGYFHVGRKICLKTPSISMFYVNRNHSIHTYLTMCRKQLLSKF